MKTIFGSIVAVLLISVTAAPSFAASATDPNNCVFKDPSLCTNESIAPLANEAPAHWVV
ncbi:hypothetical protein [Devosia riboflavina]|uniref:hypothetical protein n=1 Tax=Devosia riboflavina TaxID=46914 RepID=UPI0013633C8B|nr:hypothetical protein [Devosia riboflavina]